MEDRLNDYQYLEGNDNGLYDDEIKDDNIKDLYDDEIKDDNIKDCKWYGCSTKDRIIVDSTVIGNPIDYSALGSHIKLHTKNSGNYRMSVINTSINTWLITHVLWSDGFIITNNNIDKYHELNVPILLQPNQMVSFDVFNRFIVTVVDSQIDNILDEIASKPIHHKAVYGFSYFSSSDIDSN